MFFALYSQYPTLHCQEVLFGSSIGKEVYLVSKPSFEKNCYLLAGPWAYLGSTSMTAPVWRPLLSGLFSPWLWRGAEGERESLGTACGRFVGVRGSHIFWISSWLYWPSHPQVPKLCSNPSPPFLGCSLPPSVDFLKLEEVRENSQGSTPFLLLCI